MSRHAIAARPPSSGCAYDASGWIQPTRSWMPNARKNGDESAAGCTAEHTSWRNPGSVSGDVRTPPPMVAAASSTRASYPARASATAADSPFGPLPITVARLAMAPSFHRVGAPGGG